MVCVELVCENYKVKLMVQFFFVGEFVLDVMVFIDFKWEYGVRYCIYFMVGVGEDRGGFFIVSFNFKFLGFQLYSLLRNIEIKDGKCSVILICSKKCFDLFMGRLIKIFGE